MWSKVERLQKKYDSMVAKSEKDNIVDAKEEERIAAAKQALEQTQQTEEESARNQEELERETATARTSHEVADVSETVVSTRMEKLAQKSAEVIASEERIRWFQSLKKQVQETQFQLSWIADKSNKRAVKKAAKMYIRELDDAIRILNVNITYEHKLQNGVRFTKDVRDPHHIGDLVVKVQWWINSVDDKAADLLTGDTALADKKGKRKKDMYLPGNIHPETDLQKWTIGINTWTSRDYDVLSSSGEFWDRAGKGGLLGALDAGLEKAGAGYGVRRRTYEIGKLARWAARLGLNVYLWWNIVKEWFLAIKDGIMGGDDHHDSSTDSKEHAHPPSHFRKLVGYLLGAWAVYVWWNVADQIVRGGDTSKWIADRASGEKVAFLKEDTELMVDSSLTYGMFRDIPWKDRWAFTDNGIVDANKFHAYVLAKEGEQSPRLQYRSLVGANPADWAKVQNFMNKDMRITKAYIENAQAKTPNGNINQPYQELKEKTDAVAEIYDGQDQAKVRPMLDAIDTTLANTDQGFAFKSQKAELEKQLNILHFKHPRARPIQIGYDSADHTLCLTTYGQETKLDILSGKYIVSSPYSTTPRSADSLAEATRIAHFINFTVTTYEWVSEFDKPLNLSLDGTERDIEFSKTGGWTSGIAWIDVTILEDTWFNDFDNHFSSINKDKAGFVERLNSFEVNNESLWNKNSAAFAQIRVLEEKLKNDYGIQHTSDIEQSNRKLSGFLKALGWKYEWLNTKEYKEALMAIDKTLAKFPKALLLQTKLDALRLAKSGDLNGPRDDRHAEWISWPFLGGAIDMNIHDTRLVGNVLTHEYIHHLAHQHNTSLHEWATLSWTEKYNKQNRQTDTLPEGFITPYASYSPTEDIAEIGEILINGWLLSLKSKDGKEIVSSDLFARLQTDPILLKKVEIFTGCKVDTTNSRTPFLRPLRSDERQAYWFEWPAFFAKRCSDAGVSIDQHYWNNLKKESTS